MAPLACDKHEYVIKTGRAGDDRTCTYEVRRCLRCGAWDTNAVDHSQGFMIAPADPKGAPKQRGGPTKKRTG